MATINVYKTYSFRTKDPVIDELRTMFKDEKLLHKAGFIEIEQRGAAKAATYNNWFNKGTRRPQNATVMATAHALGYDRQWIKIGYKGKK